MSQDERPDEEPGQDELIAAFAALGGPLTDAEFMQLLGSDEYYGTMVRLALLLLDGDTAAADAVARDAFCAVQRAWGSLADQEQVRGYLYRAILDRSRSVHFDRAASGRDTPRMAPRAHEPWVSALRALPYRQREAVVLRRHLGLSELQTAQLMGISTGAASSHLARGMSLLQRPPTQ